MRLPTQIVPTLIFAVALISTAAFAQRSTSTVEIAAVGDILLDRGVRMQIETNGKAYLFERLEKNLKSPDITFGNLENPVTDECEKLEKKYSFRASPEHADILKYAGFDVLSLANNHSLDCGRIGIEETIKQLGQYQILTIGAGYDDGAGGMTAVSAMKGVRIGFAGFTAISPLAPGSQFQGVAKADPKYVLKTISELKTRVDVVVASFHWGTEYALHVNPEQVDLAKIAVDAGADVVIGHHPHVLQGIELVERNAERRKALVAYSLGNFVFDSPVRLNRLTGESMILKLEVDRGGLAHAEIVPVVIEGFRPLIAGDEAKARIQARIQRLSKELGTEIRKGRVVIENESSHNPTSIETDLDSDGKLERIELDDSREQTLRVFRGEKLLWQSVPNKWKPWKLLVADVDGDGKREIAVGVHKSTMFFPKPHNCLFIYGWSGEKGFPKWLGSSLGRPFTDFAFADLDDYPGSELAAVETTLTGKRSLAVYHWNSFGFTRYLDFGPWTEAGLVKVNKTNIELKADGETLVIDLEKSWSK